MKTKSTFSRRTSSGYALMIVMGVTAVTLVVLASTMSRTATVANLNERNNQFMVNINAAEAATEKVYARMAYDFQSYGLGQVEANLNMYRTNIPASSESPFWSNFIFSNSRGKDNQTYVDVVTPSYTGALPSQYPGLMAVGSPIYRIISNVRSKRGVNYMTNAVQEDVLLALVPITTYAIFYNSLLEFSTCATMTVNGRVHSNSNIYVGSSSTLTFNGTVTATGSISAPKNNGYTPTGDGNVDYNGNPNYRNNSPSVTLNINMTNTHSMIEIPPASESPSSHGEQRLYYQAHVVLIVTNNLVTARIQSSQYGNVPGADPSPIIMSTNLNYSAVTNMFPFLIVTNLFLDQREDKTNITTQIDIKKYGQWLTNKAAIVNKFPGNTYPTILYVADNRTVNSKQLAVVRLTNGVALPSNGGLGFTVATPNPLYVWGDYNAPNPASTDTSATVPAALMSDALTILSSSWKDSASFTQSSTGPNASSAITVNAAILTGIVPSTGSATTQFSGGVHNLPRLLENWTTSRTVWLNTSIVNLFNSTRATGQFVTPGTGSYYTAPTRKFSFDVNFLNPARQPPGVPCALIPIRYNWAIPPANTVSYNVTP